MKTKEEILGLPFYPHDCGSMIECVTKQDALKAMEEYKNQINFPTEKEQASYRIEYADSVVAQVEDLGDYSEKDLIHMGFNEGVDFLKNKIAKAQ